MKTKFKYHYFIIAGYLTFVTTLTFSAPHITGYRIPGEPHCYTKKLEYPTAPGQKLYPAQALPFKITASGVRKLAVLLVEFPSANSTTSGAAQFTTGDYNNITRYLKGLTEYYQEVSYSKFNLQITTFPAPDSAYTLSRAMEFYGNTTTDSETESRSYDLIKDAIEKTPLAEVNSVNYDGVLVFHAGYGEESNANRDKPGDIYSLFIPWSSVSAVRGFKEGCIVPARAVGGGEPFGVICHEFGHMLGLPDLYNSDTGISQVGKWCLMDAGTWAGYIPGSQPSHLSAWCKLYLGWFSPLDQSLKLPDSRVINGDALDVPLTAVETSSTAVYKIPIEAGSTAEYFLVEYRRRSDPQTKYDKSIPAEGILIWHIDDTIGLIDDNNVNNAPCPYFGQGRRVDLKEADKTDTCGQPDNTDSSDVFRDGMQLIVPDTNANNKSVTGINFISITGAGTSEMKVSVLKKAVTPVSSILEVKNYPNPYKPTSGTTIKCSFALDRPTSNMDIYIYNLAGEFIKTVPYVSEWIVPQFKDYYFPYLVEWDGNNEYGNPVTSGVYFLVLKVESTQKIIKQAIIR